MTSYRDEVAKAAIISAVERFKEEDFLFTVKAVGHHWDVYKTTHIGLKPACIAVAVIDGKLVIGLVGDSDWSEDKVAQELAMGSPS